MFSLRLLPKWMVLGMVVLCWAGPLNAGGNLCFPKRDYWPTLEWRKARPERKGMDARVLVKMAPFIKTERPEIRSVLIVRRGYLVYEEYFKDFARDYAQNTFSMTKGVTSALVGIALKQGYLRSLDQKVLDFFPEYITPDTDPLVREITLKHLLTMSSGFNKDDLYLKTTQEKIQQKIVHAPGTFFEYNNDVTDLLSPILMKATNTSLLDFAKKNLFDPLGITNAAWEIPSVPPFDQEPYQRASQGIYLTPLDMAKFGYLYLNRGKWNGKQIISADFVKASTQTRIKTDDATDYGYLWWVKPMAGHPCYFAFGRDGQYICVFQDLDMVIVITAAKEEVINMNLDIIGRFIIPSIRQ